VTDSPTPTPQALLGRPGSLGTATVIRGNARHLPLADNSVDLVVTSPPYFALRSYQDNGEHYAGQIGDEPTPTEFVDALIEVTAECVRVLKPSGSLWVNLGDKYAQAEERSRNGNGNRKAIDNFTSGSVLREPTVTLGRKDNDGVRQKSLIGIPWRYALRCIDDLGLILRAEIILDKKNGLPESVTDRVRRSHEQLFHFVKEPRYFSAVDEIRQQHNPVSLARSKRAYNAGDQFSVGQPNTLNPAQFANPLGALPGSVWPYTSEPFQPPAHLGVDHFAAFNTALPRQIILGWSPAGVCTGCGQGRRPVTQQSSAAYADARAAVKLTTARDAMMGGARSTGAAASAISNGVVRPEYAITGYACGCVEPSAATTPSVIVDPFGGTGTTALVAKALGRHGISVDMSADYGRLARWRTNDLDQLAKVQGIRRSDQARAADGLDMDTLFDFDGGAA
jgi:DNA modification methylase